MTANESRLQKMNAIARIAVGMISLFCVLPSTQADISGILQELISVAESEVAVADANVAIARQRSEALRSLRQIDDASWLEVKFAETDLQDAVDKADAHRQLVEWLVRNQVAFVEHDIAASKLELKPSMLINVSLPGSRAVLGWVDVSRLEEPLRTQTLDLLESRALGSPIPPTLLSAERNRIAALEEQIASLECAAQKQSVEIDRLRLQKRAAASTFFLIEAQARLQQAENETTLERISVIRAATPLTIAAERSNNPGYDTHLFNLLNAEATSTGQIKLSETLQDWSRRNHEAHLSLTRAGLSSSSRLARTRNELDNITLTLEGNQDLQHWRIEWLNRSTAFSRTLSGDYLAVRENQLLTGEILWSPELLRQSADLYRECVLLQAQLKSLQMRTEMQRELSEQLNEQTKPNPAELQQAALLSKLLGRQVEFLKEQIEIVRLALVSLPDLAVAQNDCPISLIHVDSEAKQQILFTAQRSGELSLQPRSYLLEQSFRERSERVKRLFEMGYASRKEVLDVEQHLLDAKSTLEAELANRGVAEIDCQLLETILTPSAPESAVTAATQSAGQ